MDNNKTIGKSTFWTITFFIMMFFFWILLSKFVLGGFDYGSGKALSFIAVIIGFIVQLDYIVKFTNHRTIYQGFIGVLLFYIFYGLALRTAFMVTNYNSDARGLLIITLTIIASLILKDIKNEPENIKK
jgi:hypothetical protein